MNVSEDTVYMCAACRTLSGNGQYAEVTYFSWGGCSPFIEGRRCKHVDIVDIFQYVKAPIKWQEQEYQGTKYRTAEWPTEEDKAKILKWASEGIPVPQICADLWKETGWMFPLHTVIKFSSPTKK